MGNNTSGEKELKTEWPVVSGLSGGTFKQEGRVTNLVPEQGSLYPKRLKEGMDY